MNPKLTIGKRIVDARAKASPRLSQRDLVKRLKEAGLDISLKELAEIEAGNRSPKQFQVTVLASVLNTTAFQLLS